MRIIAGKHKRRELKRVESLETRETSDKVRESVFNIIGPYFQYEKVLDLFAGSGAYGIEAISRGASYVALNDNQYKAFQTITANVELIHATSMTLITQKDYGAALSHYAALNITFDLVFLDPPYHLLVTSEIIETLQSKSLLSADATVVVEVEKKTDLRPVIGNLELVKTATYGIKKIGIYQ